jgi:CRISPR system Cascade subunit CasC
MGDFLQLHLVHAYGPNCLNRDEQGRPKTAVIGGVTRQRISSQCLKSWWRTSAVFKEHVGNSIGIRTRTIGPEIVKHLTGSVGEAKAKSAAVALTKLWKAERNAEREGKGDTLFLFTRGEWERAKDLALRHAQGKIKDIKHEDLLTGEDTAVDVALWGRMLAVAPKYNVTAACSVSHAITTHPVTVEQDYFTARNERPQEDQGSGAGHLATKDFGAGVYYTYACVDRALLLSNLHGNTKLRDAAIEGLIRAAATVSPGGMQSTMASQAYAAYALVELGDQQPRTLHPAFARPVRGANLLADTVTVLEAYRDTLAAVYGPTCAIEAAIDTTGASKLAAKRTLSDVIAIAKRPLQAKEAA